MYLQAREMVHDFYESRYASCLSHLEKMQPALSLDVHLQRHAVELITAVSKSNPTRFWPSNSAVQGSARLFC